MAKEEYQTLNAHLEEVLAKLQSSDIGVDEAVVLYEEGLKLVVRLEAHLKQAENKIEQLKLQAKG